MIDLNVKTPIIFSTKKIFFESNATLCHPVYTETI